MTRQAGSPAARTRGRRRSARRRGGSRRSPAGWRRRARRVDQRRSVSVTNRNVRRGAGMSSPGVRTRRTLAPLRRGALGAGGRRPARWGRCARRADPARTYPVPVARDLVHAGGRVPLVPGGTLFDAADQLAMVVPASCRRSGRCHESSSKFSAARMPSHCRTRRRHPQAELSAGLPGRRGGEPIDADLEFVVLRAT